MEFIIMKMKIIKKGISLIKMILCRRKGWEERRFFNEGLCINPSASSCAGNKRLSIDDICRGKWECSYGRFRVVWYERLCVNWRNIYFLGKYMFVDMK